MLRYFKLIAILTAFLVALTVAPRYINFAGLIPEIEQTFKSQIGINMKIDGEVFIQILPTPAVNITQLTIETPNNSEIKFEIPNLQFGTSITGLMGGDIEVNSIEIGNASLRLDALDDFFSHMKSQDSQSTALETINLKNISLVLNSSERTMSRIDSINGIFSYEPLEYLHFNGDFIIDELNYSLNMKLNVDKENKQDGNSSFKVKTQYFEMDFVGDLNKKASKYGLSGRVIGNLVNANSASHTDTNAFLLAILRDNLNFKATLNANEEEFSLTDASINSDNIQKIDATVVYTLGQNPEFNASFITASLNADKVMANLDSAGNYDKTDLTLEKVVKELLVSFNLSVPQAMTGSIKTTIGEIITQGQAIKDIALNSSIYQGKFVVNNMSMSLPGEANLAITGTLSHNDIRPKFNGNLTVNVNNFEDFAKWLNFDSTTFSDLAKNKLTLKSGLSIIPRSLRLDDIQVNWADLIFTGKFGIKNSGEKRLNAILSAKVNKYEAARFSTDVALDNIITNLYAYDFDKSGKSFYEVTGDFKWLREFPLLLSFELATDALVYKDLTFANSQFSGQINPNNLNFDAINVENDMLNMSGSASLISSLVAPKIDLDLKVKKMDYRIFSNILPADEVLMAKQAEAMSKYPDDASNVIVGGLNFFSLNNFIANYKFAVESYGSRNGWFSNLQIEGQAQDGLIAISTFKGRGFGGDLDVVSNIGISTNIPAYNVNFALNNFKMHDLLKYYAGYENIDGYFSISGNFTSKGADPATFLSNISGSGQVVGKKVSWDTIDIGQIIGLSEMRAQFQEKADQLKIAVIQGRSSFDEAKGKITLSDGKATLEGFTFTSNRVSGGFSAVVDIYYKMISYYTRLSFIPVNRGAQMSIDITGTGEIGKLQPTIKYDQYLTFLKDTGNIDPLGTQPQTPGYLRGFRQ